MSEKQTTVIEVNGVKLEVDLRTAKRIDQLQIGSRVKCLVKSYDSFETKPGVVVGFEPFPSKPSIVVAYLETGYGNAGLKFKTFNDATKDFEIVADIDNNALEVDKVGVVEHFDREIAKKELELRDLREKKQFFLDKFETYFTEHVPA